MLVMTTCRQILSVPNILTVARVVSLPFIIVLFRQGHTVMAACVFVACMATDYLDGWLAKRLGQVTLLGRYLDPVVDKIVILALLYEVAGARIIDWPVPHLFLTRELLQNAVRAVAATRGSVIGANWMGKTKAVLQTIVVAGALLTPAFGRCFQTSVNAAAWAVLCVAWVFFVIFAVRNRCFLVSS